jgi:hypothetical protein
VLQRVAADLPGEPAEALPDVRQVLVDQRTQRRLHVDRTGTVGDHEVGDVVDGAPVAQRA